MNKHFENTRKDYKKNEESKKLKDEFDSLKFKEDWIKTEADENMIEYCSKIAKILVDVKVTSSQLRNIYGEILRIKMKRNKRIDSKNDLILLKPKLYYNNSRMQKELGKEIFNKFIKNHLEKAIKIAIDNFNNDKIFNNFHNYFEAILAYHKYWD
ncbi:MAG: hypothetical protein KatS3mg027_1992 [Bacteroidia bacterium]|nr:MAG: hypothetical protein KatS3mg027_1992 [Bacteroidia bacterium]